MKWVPTKKPTEPEWWFWFNDHDPIVCCCFECVMRRIYGR